MRLIPKLESSCERCLVVIAFYALFVETEGSIRLLQSNIFKKVISNVVSSGIESLFVPAPDPVNTFEVSPPTPKRKSSIKEKRVKFDNTRTVVHSSNATKNVSNEGDNKPSESREFLVGEDTPVWIARAGQVFEKLPKGIVRKAMDHMAEILPDELNEEDYSNTNADKFGKLLQNAGDHITIDDKTTNNDKKNMDKSIGQAMKIQNFTEDVDLQELVELVITEGKLGLNRLKLQTFSVVYPTILVVMDYKKIMETFYSNDREIVKKYIMYALIFWNNVNVRLSSIKNPTLSLRIGGIVISDNSGSEEYGPFPYMDPKNQKYSGELQPMYTFWRHNMTKNKDFPTNSYDIVAHMADFSYDEQGLMWNPIYRPGVSQRSPSLCDPKNYWNTIKIWEYDHFRGGESAEHAMRIVLGEPMKDDPSTTKVGDLWPKMTETSRNFLEYDLKHAKCFAEPKEYHPPGKPIPSRQIPLPGELINITEQCKKLGYTIVKWNPNILSGVKTCRLILCGYDSYGRIKLPVALDGTTCYRIGLEPSVCVQGECVVNKWTANRSKQSTDEGSYD